MKHHSSLATTTLAVAFAWSLRGVGPVAAQIAPAFPDVRGHYRGFSQSIGDPGLRGPVELMIDSENFTKGSFSGHLTMVAQAFLFAGSVEMDGRFKGRGDGAIGAVTFTGKMDGSGGGEIGGRTFRRPWADSSITSRPRAPPARPIRATGNSCVTSTPICLQTLTARGQGSIAATSSGGMGTVDLMVQQRDVTGMPGTGFSGQEVVDRCNARPLMFDFVGTINARGDKILVIGLGAAGQFLVGGMLQPPIVGGMLQPPPDNDRAQFTYLLNFVNQGIDLGTFGVMKTELPPGPC